MLPSQNRLTSMNRVGELSISVYESLYGFSVRWDLALTKMCMQVEIPVAEKFTLTIVNNLAPDCNVNIL